MPVAPPMPVALGNGMAQTAHPVASTSGRSVSLWRIQRQENCILAVQAAQSARALLTTQMSLLPAGPLAAMRFAPLPAGICQGSRPDCWTADDSSRAAGRC